MPESVGRTIEAARRYNSAPGYQDGLALGGLRSVPGQRALVPAVQDGRWVVRASAETPFSGATIVSWLARVWRVR